MDKKLLFLIKVLSIFIKKDKNLITILFKGYSGSNATPIIEKLTSEKSIGYKIKVLYEDTRKIKINSSWKEKMSILKNKLEKYIYVLKSHLVISTHGFYRLRNDNIMLNLWHGIPLKAMSLMNKGKTDLIGFIQDDYFISTSDFYNTIMNACLGLTVEKYYITGYPRNDYLFNQCGLKNLTKVINRKIDKKEKVILYLPTYRKGSSQEHDRNKNIFGFSNFDLDKFNAFLKSNNLLFILKLHPNEEKIFINQYSRHSNKNIVFLKEENLKKHKIDLYKVLNAVDLLITDYSSVYFDFLLLDRPIIFVPVDIEEYRKFRGLLLEPYDFWTPGPKCMEQNDLQKEILKSLDNKNYYKKERNDIKNLVHKYQDANSTERVLQLIDVIMNR